MLLFLTREAFCKRSMEERRCEEGECSSSKAFSEFTNRVGEVGSRSCQKACGETAFWKGDELNGEDSRSNNIFCVGDWSMLELKKRE